jgi:galactokinase
VPLGGGLSSSAALEVAVLRALRTAYDLPIDDVELALIGQRAEARFVGVPVGAMDQLAASLGRLGSALFIDLRSLEIHLLALPAVDLVVIGSGLRHDHAAGDYRTRRAECEDAARRLGVRTLREVGIADLPAIAALPPPLDRRARHVVTENARVRAAVHAIETSDLRALGEQLAAGHASMRDDFEASLPEIDRLVAIAGADPAIWGARITGGGFGGAIVALAKRSQGAAAAARIAAGYLAETGIRPHILVPGGA